MLFRPTNPTSHRLARAAFWTACVSALVVAAAGPAHRFIGLDREISLTIFRYGFYLSTAAIALGLATLVPTRPGERRRGFVAAALAVMIGSGAAVAPLAWLMHAHRAPALNDITTDPANPPKLVVTLDMRRSSATNGPAYPPDAAAIQKAAYPEIVPIVLAVPPAEAFKKVDAVATALGWDVVARAPNDGRLEAVATSEWFGFQDDISIRIRPDGKGSRIDIRSKSRSGMSDLGVNAQRIRQFNERLKAAR